MKTSAVGLSLLTTREGRKLVAYQDSVGVWTIGVGHTGRMSGSIVTPGMRITSDESDAFLAADLAPVEAAINGLGVPLDQNQFDALASFAFNIGVPGFKGSHVVAYLRQGVYAQAADAMMNWVKPAVLRKRREAERRQFLTPYTATSVSAGGPSPAPRDVPKAATQDIDIMGNLLGSVASIIEGVITKGSAVATVATAAPTIIEGAFKSIDEAERGFKALAELVSDVRGGRWNEVPEDITAIIAEFKQIMINFGIDHDGLNSAAVTAAKLGVTQPLKAA